MCSLNLYTKLLSKFKRLESLSQYYLLYSEEKVREISRIHPMQTILKYREKWRPIYFAYIKQNHVSSFQKRFLSGN